MIATAVSKRTAALRSFDFGAVLLVALLILNIWLTPARFAPAALGTLLGLAAPLMAAALASTPVILGGRGGIDISVGPLMGFLNAVIVTQLIGSYDLQSPAILIPAAILIGATVGAINGALATLVRIQPIVATLGTYLILTGLTVTLVPAPTGTIPDWLRLFSQSLSILPLAGIALVWWAMRRAPYYDLLMATGSDDRAAYTAGVNIALVRWLSYVLTGAFAGIASLSLTALIGSADPGIGPTYTLLAISAVALGGVNLAGGRGGLINAAIGAADIFLLQTAITYFNISTFILQIIYGAVLVLAVAIMAIQERWLQRRRAA
jgi:ribose transport system permease protein